MRQILVYGDSLTWGIISCALCEEEIARRIEDLYLDAKGTQQRLLDANPDLLEINAKLFAPLRLEQQFRLQARGERLEAATWRAFAAHASAEKARDAFLECALLEEESAVFLESIGRAVARPR